VSDTYLASSVQTGVAVVAEGGGQRGIFTAGVLDAFLDDQFNPFELGLGVSAGAQNLLSFFLGEQGYAKRAIAELTAEPVYLQPDKRTVLTHLKASSAVPFLYKAPVTVGKDQLVDGGVADPLPVLKAIELGAKHIVVIRTVSDDATQSSWRQRVDALPLRRALPNTLLQMLDTHDQAYTRAIETIKQPPQGVNIVSIAPNGALKSHAFGSGSEAIVSDYETGRACGAQMVSQLQSWLPQQNKKNLRTLKDSEIDSAPV